MKLLLDEMLSPAIARELRERNIDAVAVAEQSSLVGLGDEDLLRHPEATGRTLVTLNIADFAAIAARWRAAGHEHAGIVYAAYRTFPQNRAFAGAVTTALAAPDLADAVRVEREVFLRPVTAGR